MTKREYSISELAEKANISVRTVRFYIEEGLLHAPAAQGRYAVYTEEHLDRLELIRQLKEQFLPLREIRTQLQALDGQGVKTALDQMIQFDPIAPSASRQPLQRSQQQDGASALDYIQRVMSRQMAPPLPAAAPMKKEEGETWQRITIADGVELTIRHPILQNERSKIAQLIHLARKIFPSDRQGDKE